MIKYITQDKIDILILDNSENGNVLNIDSLHSFIDALKKAETNSDSRAVILKSNGENFCLGMDLKFLEKVDDTKIAESSIMLYNELLTRIHTIHKPVISIINGKVKAGGMGIVGASDIAIASETSTFEFSEIYFGLIPANVLPFIYNIRLTPQKLKYLILTAKQLNANEALQIGLIDNVFSQAELNKGIKKIIKNLFRVSPAAAAETKKFINELYNKDTAYMINLAREELLGLIKQPEVLDAVKSFNNGLLPKWFERFKTNIDFS